MTQIQDGVEIAPENTGSSPADGPSAQPPVAVPVRAAGTVVTRRWAIVLVVILAGIAAYVSARHQYGLARVAGQPPSEAWALPALIDGTIAMASVVLLDAARRKIGRPPLAIVALACGIAATVAANVAAGWPGGPISRLVSAVPPLAFAVAIHMLMGLLRRTEPAPTALAHDQGADRTPADDPPLAFPVARTVTDAARLAYTASVAEASPMAERRVADQFGLSRTQARQIIGDAVADAVLSGLRNGAPMPTTDQVSRQYGITERRAGEVLAWVDAPSAGEEPEPEPIASINGASRTEVA